MKNTIKLFGVIALLAIIGFSFTACSGDDSSGGDSNGDAETLTYKGKGATSGDTYTLTIKKTAARAFTPIKGDEFELSDGTDKSKGKVDSFNGSNFTLQPSNNGAPTFGATVSGSDLTGLSGTITLTDGRKVTVDEALTPSGGPGTVTPPVTGGSGIKTWTSVDVTSIFGGYYETIGSTTMLLGGKPIQAIAYGNGKFVAGSYQGKMAYSSDGKTWTPVADTKLDEAINAIAYGGSVGQEKFVAGAGRGKMAYSSDGITWTAVTNTTFTGVNDTINAIAYGNGKFVAGGDAGKMAYSSDGITWTAVPSGTGEGTSRFSTLPIKAIAYGNNKFVAVGGSLVPRMAYSSDGVAWTAVEPNPYGTYNEIINAIAFGNGTFIAGGYSGNYDGKIMFSTDGITWTVVTIREGTVPSIIYTIAFGNGTFVAAGYTDDYMAYTTNNGTTWSKVNTDTYMFNIFNGDSIKAVAYGNGTFVAGNSGGVIAYSTGN